MSKHTAIWLDQKEAHVFHIDPEHVDTQKVLAPAREHHRHPKGAEGGKGHPDDAKRYFGEIVQTLGEAERILVLGPSTAKLSFLRFLHQTSPDVEGRVVGVETVDHPSDGQLLAYARKYFTRSDRMQ